MADKNSFDFTSKGKMVRIGCSSAFWGDTPTAAHQLVLQGGHLDYLVADYLAEVTMTILARSKSKSEEKGGMGKGGYVAEFVETVWKPLMSQFISRKIKIVTNAGGMNPEACKEAIEKCAKDAGLAVPVVAVVTGDDLMPNLDSLRNSKSFKAFDVSGEVEPLWDQDKVLISCNAYVGAAPIAEALKRGAQIVITGRAADSSLVLGPLMHEFGWKLTDYDLLSAGSLAGHIIECGCQATGGNFTDWQDSAAEGWDNVGFPIVECFADGSFIVTKPDNTGGLVTPATVGEQMLYEIGDPAAYILPDVICDWRMVQMTELPKRYASQKRSNKVLVQNAKGMAPTPFYKVGATSFEGFTLSASLAIGGIEAAQKAETVAKAILTKTRRIFQLRGIDDYTDTRIEILGAEATYGPHSRVRDSREVIGRITVHHTNPKALSILASELAPAATGMAPGMFGGLGSGRPRPTPSIKYYSALVSKQAVAVTVKVGKDSETFHYVPTQFTDKIQPPPVPLIPENSSWAENPVKVPLIALAYGRSGDKGDVCNIGILARKKEYYPILKQALTEQAVKNYFSHLVKGTVKRFELPGVHGFNFILTKALGGGGVSSLNVDRQGKAYAQQLLSLEVTVPREWVADSKWLKTSKL